jgi:hypothetical protein
VFKAIQRKAQRVLFRTGAYARKAMQRRMRRRKKASRPGDAPSAHENPLIKKRLFYGYDPTSESIVVGPETFKPPKGHRLAGGQRSIVEVLDAGGSIVRSNRDGESIRAQIEPRPIAGPVLPDALSKMEDELARGGL